MRPIWMLLRYTITHCVALVTQVLLLAKADILPGA